MNYDNAVAVVMAEANKFIDKLELETSIPLSDREFLAVWQAKILASASTKKTEDIRLAKIFETWLIRRHRITK